MVAQATADGAVVILTTIFPVGPVSLERLLFWSPAVESAINTVNAFIKAQQSPQVIIMDTYALLSRNGVRDEQYAFDFLHINAAGYERLNRELTGILERLN